MRSAKILTFAFLLLAAVSAQAGEIHPTLEARMGETPIDEPLSVIVHLSEQAPIAQLNEELKAQRATLQKRHRDVVLALQDAARSQAALKSYLDERQAAGSVLGYTSHWISNLIVVYAQQEEILAIASRSDVQLVELNFRPVLIEPVGMRQTFGGETGGRGIGVTPGQRAIRSPEVWYELDITGRGRLVGSMDTGVDGTHPALTTRWRGNHAPWQECWLDLLDSPPTTYPNDSGQHGTHTTGTLTGVAYDDTIGVAWDAEWIACNVIGQGVNEEFDNDVIAAFEWFADPDGNPETVDDVPDVVQNSWGVHEGLGYPDCFSLWWNVIDNCEAAGCATCWSAGNSGDEPATIGSPADRATTLTNSFSVGAVDATNYDWPYPIADFSSRGPTNCEVPEDHRIKPEVVAPGVQVYSSVPGGIYQENGWDGTSMSGPHAAGIIALLRQANPNLDVDTMKEIIMLTARDEGDSGEDNTYGHGFVDAYAAVLISMEGFGELNGYVRNGSFGDLPLPDATVALLGAGFSFYSDEDGYYDGMAAPDTYTAEASFPGFAPQEFPVLIEGEGITVQDFSLTDIAGPEIRDVSQPGNTPGTEGPYLIEATIIDYSTIVEARLYYRLNQGGWTSVPMTPQGEGIYLGSISGMPLNTTIDYYVWAEDGIGFDSLSPAGAPEDFYTLLITGLIYAYDAEDPGDPAWRLGILGDDAIGGIWVREDPVGTEWSGMPVQPEDDHTPDPGVKCFVTGNGEPGGSAHAADVDYGCTTLMSPTFDLSEPERAFVNYWRWFAQIGITDDDELAVDVSNDGGHAWVALERVPGNENSWQRVAVELNTLITLSDQVVFRFVACDNNVQGLVEAAIDDFAVEGFTSTLTAAPGWGPNANAIAGLRQSQPNPFRPENGATNIAFSLTRSTEARLQVFDISGRLVRTLARGDFAAGAHEIRWNGRDERGHAVSSGVYFYRLKAGERVESRRLVLIR